MPELPEVETVRRQLQDLLCGRCITGAQVFWRRTLGGQSPKDFALSVRGARFDAIQRHGKQLLLGIIPSRRDAGAPSHRRDAGAPSHRRDAGAAQLTGGVILAHLRMTGRFFVEPLPRTLGKWDRVVLELDGKDALVFLDVRKFGRLQFCASADAALSTLGPDPLLPQFSRAWLRGALQTKRRALKPLLLDQSFIAGLGNIYVDESLHTAGLHPLRSAASLEAEESNALHSAILKVLRGALAKGGSSFDSFYRTPAGQPGRYQAQFRVYGRHGKPCRGCASTIQRAVLGQRGTWWCPQCQPAPARRHRSEAAFKD